MLKTRDFQGCLIRMIHAQDNNYANVCHLVISHIDAKSMPGWGTMCPS